MLTLLLALNRYIYKLHKDEPGKLNFNLTEEEKAELDGLSVKEVHDQLYAAAGALKSRSG
jgi:hypothetical protein